MVADGYLGIIIMYVLCDLTRVFVLVDLQTGDVCDGVVCLSIKLAHLTAK
jgi:hypothetical protein